MSRATQIKRLKRRGFLFHTALVLFTALFYLAAVLFIGLFTVFNGPSPTVSDTVVRSLTQTSALKFVPYLFMSETAVEDSLARTSSDGTTATTDTSMYSFLKKPSADEGAADPSTEYEAGSGMQVVERAEKPAEPEKAEEAPVREDPYGVGAGIRIDRLVKDTFKGYIAIIDDPSRVSVGIASDFKSGLPGKLVSEIADSYGAILAVNGGAFEDPYGKGTGGVPGGLLISDGVLYHGATETLTSAGFDGNDCLIVGRLTTKQGQELGLRDCVAYGPALIVNGEVNAKALNDVSRNPRTAIGQRADGAVLLLVADGRHLDSVGACMADLIEIMQEYGAINACNLDGGSSTVMYANGKQLNEGAAIIGTRRIPTAIIVR